MTRPIIFTADSVIAILEGRKTQTRRLVRPPKKHFTPVRCPHPAGSIRWVKEPWQAPVYPNIKPSEVPERTKIIYKADGELWKSWRTPLFMCEWMSRLKVRIISVETDKVQNISVNDVLAEGVKILDKDEFFNPVDKFASLWNKINGNDSWLDNPTVWIYTLEVVE